MADGGPFTILGTRKDLCATISTGTLFRVRSGGRISWQRDVVVQEWPGFLDAFDKFEERQRQNNKADVEWVQCDDCKKWRLTVITQQQAKRKRWNCSRNTDPERRTCDAAEEEWDDADYPDFDRATDEFKSKNTTTGSFTSSLSPVGILDASATPAAAPSANRTLGMPEPVAAQDSAEMAPAADEDEEDEEEISEVNDCVGEIAVPLEAAPEAAVDSEAVVVVVVQSQLADASGAAQASEGAEAPEPEELVPMEEDGAAEVDAMVETVQLGSSEPAVEAASPSAEEPAVEAALPAAAEAAVEAASSAAAEAAMAAARLYEDAEADDEALATRVAAAQSRLTAAIDASYRTLLRPHMELYAADAIDGAELDRRKAFARQQAAAVVGGDGAADALNTLDAAFKTYQEAAQAKAKALEALKEVLSALETEAGASP